MEMAFSTYQRISELGSQLYSQLGPLEISEF